MFDINHIANLSRMSLSENEKTKFQKDFLAILNFIEKLKEVNVDGIEPMSQATGSINIMRSDEIKKFSEEEKKAILDNAPEVKNGHIKVKAIFE